jgi:hypothetical protein
VAAPASDSEDRAAGGGPAGGTTGEQDLARVEAVRAGSAGPGMSSDMMSSRVRRHGPAAPPCRTGLCATSTSAASTPAAAGLRSEWARPRVAAARQLPARAAGPECPGDSGDESDHDMDGFGTRLGWMVDGASAGDWPLLKAEGWCAAAAVAMLPPVCPRAFKPVGGCGESEAHCAGGRISVAAAGMRR